MSKKIEVQDSWDIVRMPANADSNYEYRVVWNEITGHFEVLPF